VAVHHTVSPPDRSIDSLAAYHVNSRGWPGIGYHYVVTDFGRIFLTNYIESVSYHVGNPNTYTVGIALQGNFTDHPPPQAQQDAARWLVSFLKGYLKKDLDVRGHRHMPGASTQCPGNTLDSWLPYVIGDDYEPPPPEPPQPTTYDLAYYMAAFLDSNGPLYEVQTLGGGQERHQTQTASGGMFWHTKNRNWEELSVSDTYILRGTDTSQSGTTYYTLRDGGTYWSEWAPREMVIGEVFGRDPIVAVYRKRDCSIVSQGAQESWLRLDAIHSTWTSPAAAGIQLDDVMQLSWLATPDPDSWIERYFYAAGYGLVGWQSRTTTAGISEIHPKGSRPDNQRMVIGCLDRS